MRFKFSGQDTLHLIRDRVPAHYQHLLYPIHGQGKGNILKDVGAGRHTFVNKKDCDIPDHEKEKKEAFFLACGFSKSELQKINQYYLQNVSKYPYEMLLALFSNLEHLLRVKLDKHGQHLQFCNIYKADNHIFFNTEIDISLVQFSDPEIEENIGNKKLRVVMKLTDDGFELDSFETNDRDVYDLVRKGYNNFLDKPFGQRLESAFHHIFNDHNAHRSNTAAFFGIPTSGNVFNYTGIPLILITIPKNALKLITEYVPAFFEAVFGYLADKAKRYWIEQRRLKAKEQNKLGLVVAFFVSLITRPLEYFFSGMRQLTAHITSPIRAIKEAYYTGEEMGGKVLGVIFGALGVALSTAGLVAASIVTLPIVAASTGLSGIGVIAAYTVKAAMALSQLPVLSTASLYVTSALSTLGIKSVAGIVLTKAMTTAGSAAAFVYTAALAPYKLIKAASAWFTRWCFGEKKEPQKSIKPVEEAKAQEPPNNALSSTATAHKGFGSDPAKSLDAPAQPAEAPPVQVQAQPVQEQVPPPPVVLPLPEADAPVAAAP